MPNEPNPLARSIVRAYRDHGIAAKLYRGTIFVEREGGLEGPFDPETLRESHAGEIDRLQASVREAVADSWKRHEEDLHRRGESPEAHAWAIDREIWFPMVFGKDFLMKDGMSEPRAQLYARIAAQLMSRGELWR